MDFLSSSITVLEDGVILFAIALIFYFCSIEKITLSFTFLGSK